MIWYQTLIKIVVPLQQFLWNILYFKHSTDGALKAWENQSEAQSWKKSHQVLYSSYLTKVFFHFRRLDQTELTWIHLAHVASFVVTAIISPLPIWLQDEDTICLKGRGRGRAITKSSEEGVTWAPVLLVQAWWQREEELIKHLCN